MIMTANLDKNTMTDKKFETFIDKLQEQKFFDTDINHGTTSVKFNYGAYEIDLVYYEDDDSLINQSVNKFNNDDVLFTENQEEEIKDVMVSIIRKKRIEIKNKEAFDFLEYQEEMKSRDAENYYMNHNVL